MNLTLLRNRLRGRQDVLACTAFPVPPYATVILLPYSNTSSTGIGPCAARRMIEEDRRCCMRFDSRCGEGPSFFIELPGKPGNDGLHITSGEVRQ